MLPSTDSPTVLPEEPNTQPPVDTQALRVLAHPLRSRLLSELRALGPSTSAELARTLKTNTGATSYHLRRLEKAGLVVDTGDGVGRQRMWRAQTEGRAVETPTDDENVEAAMDWLARDYVQHFSDKAQEWITHSSEWSPDWQESTGLDDHLVLVSSEQLASLREEISELLARHRRVGAGNPQAKRVVVYVAALPVDRPNRF
ncbi:ArsR/SmtB family transcription factor [Austwickia chelonae]|uniref:ArsR/SmtB family transcription factor n=1 Tax=Austwickia chelonae TaxID=100225 RepID=UPI000E2711ED|nr:helix-turn-helix domain-containing protein [Austwickia chelonae]